MTEPLHPTSGSASLPKSKSVSLSQRILLAAIAPLMISICGLRIVTPELLVLVRAMMSYFTGQSVPVTPACQAFLRELVLISCVLLASYFAGIILILVTSIGVITGKTSAWYFHICIWLMLSLLGILFVQNIAGLVMTILVGSSIILPFLSSEWRAFYHIPPLRSSRFLISLFSHALVVLLIPFAFKELSLLVPQEDKSCSSLDYESYNKTN
jgi:hypothetical protein